MSPTFNVGIIIEHLLSNYHSITTETDGHMPGNSLSMGPLIKYRLTFNLCISKTVSFSTGPLDHLATYTNLNGTADSAALVFTGLILVAKCS